jgi:transcriptional regulator with XRE-family HTH domain
MSVGPEIRRLRQAKGWTLAQLSVYAEMSPSAVSQIETGRRSPTAASLEKLAEALEVEVRDLFPKLQPPLLEVPQAQRGSSWITPEHRRRIASYVRHYLGKVERHEMTAEEAFEELEVGLEAELERRYDAIQM